MNFHRHVVPCNVVGTEKFSRDLRKFLTCSFPGNLLPLVEAVPSVSMRSFMKCALFQDSSNLGAQCIISISSSSLNFGNKQKRRVEAGSNTSTVALRVVDGDAKKTRCLGV
jgi:hypothetical protein